MTDQANTPEIACSLNDEEMRARRTLARKTVVPHIIESRTIEGGLELQFSESAEVRTAVELFVSLERECCGFLTFSLTQPADGLTLTIEGPPEAAAVVETFIDQLQN